MREGKIVWSWLEIVVMSYAYFPQICIKYAIPDAVPPIHAESYHVATDKDPSKFQSIFSDNLQPIATRGKKVHGTLLVDISCSIKLAPLSVSYTTKLAAAILVVAVVQRRGSVGPVLPLWYFLLKEDLKISTRQVLTLLRYDSSLRSCLFVF